jgi:hypothetical protein
MSVRALPIWTAALVLLYVGRMPQSRVDVKLTIGPEALAHANTRARELATPEAPCHRSTVVEALLRLDQRGAVPGLAAEVAVIQREVKEGQSARGEATIGAARAARWRPPTA